MKWLIIIVSSLYSSIVSYTFSCNKETHQKVSSMFNLISFNNYDNTSNNTLLYIQKMTDSFFESLRLYIKNEVTTKAVDKCYSSISKLLTKEQIHNFYDFSLYSGKGFSDIGSENECTYKKYTYFKAIYGLNLEKLSRKDEIEVIRFLNQTNFYTGICLIEECKEAIDAIIENDNQALFSFLESEYYIKDIALLYPPDQPYKPSVPLLSFFIIVIYFIIAYFSLKIIITGIKITCFSSEGNQFNRNSNSVPSISNNSISNIDLEDDENEMSQNSNDNSNNDDEDDLNEHVKGKRKIKLSKPRMQNNRQIFKNRLKSIFHNQNINIKQQQEPELMRNSLVLRFLNFFDLFENIKYLSSLSNKYFNDKRIALFTFVRILLMIFITYNHNFFTITKMPGKDFLNSDFYKSFLFFFIKLSSYSSSLWIIVDAATFSYKFMCSIKNELKKTNKQSISIVFILRWWLLIIPKIITFFFIFYFFHYFIPHYKYFIPNTGTMFEFYLNNFQSRECTKNPSELLIPFALAYKDSYGSFSYCYRFCYIFINEFYLFIFFTVYFYLAFKIKSKILDYAVLAITVLNIGLITLSIPFRPSNEFYYINAVLGQVLNEKYVHLSFNFYLLGIYIGMSYFYYYDAVSRTSLTQTDIYLPFRFCFSMVKYLDTLRYRYKKLLLYVLVFLCFLDSLSYYFIRLVRKTEENTLLFKIDLFINVYDQYDKILVGIVFSLILVLLLLFPKETTIRNLINSNLFIIFSRLSFAYFCLSNTIIYVVYCVLIIQLKLSYPNLMFVTLGLLLINSFISLVIVIMFELPFRVLVKKLVRCCEKIGFDAQDNEDAILLEKVNNSMRLLADD